MKPLKNFLWPSALLHLLASAEAPGSRPHGACSFTLSVSGLDGPVGQLPDGRLSIGGREPAATFRTDTRTGALVDIDGIGCTITSSSPGSTLPPP
ncbi:hypothetical protein IMZ48_22100, partial [Candidatus Bathyarchaeota archaeon]|nr:hypothetical protein [Candidatus Bathyarchaeota archaeon]